VKQLLLHKPGALSEAERARAEKAGYVCIETNDFDAFRVIDPAVPLDREVLFKCAMIAISTTTKEVGPKTRFGEAVAERLARS
jgi:hypothetical protein